MAFDGRVAMCAPGTAATCAPGTLRQCAACTCGLAGWHHQMPALVQPTWNFVERNRTGTHQPFSPPLGANADDVLTYHVYGTTPAGVLSDNPGPVEFPPLAYQVGYTPFVNTPFRVPFTGNGGDVVKLGGHTHGHVSALFFSPDPAVWVGPEGPHLWTQIHQFTRRWASLYRGARQAADLYSWSERGMLTYEPGSEVGPTDMTFSDCQWMGCTPPAGLQVALPFTVNVRGTHSCGQPPHDNGETLVPIGHWLLPAGSNNGFRVRGFLQGIPEGPLWHFTGATAQVFVVVPGRPGGLATIVENVGGTALFDPSMAGEPTCFTSYAESVEFACSWPMIPFGEYDRAYMFLLLIGGTYPREETHPRGFPTITIRERSPAYFRLDSLTWL